VLADTRRLSTSALARFGGRCACTSYSVFKEPTCPPSRRKARKWTAQARVHPAWQAPNTRPLAVFRGTFLHYYSHLLAVKCRSTSIPWAPAARAEATSQRARRRLTPTRMSKNFRRVSCLGARESPGAWGLTNRKNNPIYTRRGRACQPIAVADARGLSISTLSAGAAPRRATHVKAASHTAANAHANLKECSGPSVLLSNPHGSAPRPGGHPPLCGSAPGQIR
jgi:hypothetical protein